MCSMCDSSVESIADLSVNDRSTMEQQSDGTSTKQRAFVKLFIGEIGPNSTEDSIRTYFEQFGNVDRVVVKHSFNDRQRSFAFVSLESDRVEQVTRMDSPDTIASVVQLASIPLSTVFAPIACP